MINGNIINIEMLGLIAIWFLYCIVQSDSEPEPDLVALPADILQKSIVNFGQLSPRVRKKLSTNQCLDLYAYGTSITCAQVSGQFKVHAPDFEPRRFEDGWTYQLLEYLNKQLPPCYRNKKLSNHSFLQVRCYEQTSSFDPAEITYTEVVKEPYNSQYSWFESVQLQRRNTSSKLLKADIIFVEPMVAITMTNSQKDTERLMYSLLSLKSQPSVIYIGASFVYRNMDVTVWQSFDDKSRGSDTVPYQLVVAKHYGVPFVSAVDALGPFLTPASQAWVTSRFIVDKVCHLTRLGHQIVGLLVANYLRLASLSLKNPFYDTDDDFYQSYSLVKTLYTLTQELHDLVTDKHPPLTIPFVDSDGGPNYSFHMFMIDSGDGWEVSGIPRYLDKWGMQSSAVNGPPLVLVIPHDSVHLHFAHQKLRFVIGKNTHSMGTLLIEVSVFGHHENLASMTVDCLLPVETASSSSSGAPDSTGDPDEYEYQSFQWVEYSISIEQKLNEHNSLQLKFSVIASSPARDMNIVKLGSIHLS